MYVTSQRIQELLEVFSIFFKINKKNYNMYYML